MLKNTVLVLAVSSALAFGIASGTYAQDTSATSEPSHTISADELAQIDANADGTITSDELTAAADAGSVACGAQGIQPMFTGIGEVTEADAATAKNIRIVEVANCDAADVDASLGASNNVRLMLSTNDRVTAAVHAKGATIDDVLRVGTTNDALVVFIPTDPVDLGRN